jgi:hypothetical protein
MEHAVPNRHSTPDQHEHGDRAQIQERRYDSFVVRLWIDPARSTWLRAEVEHVQTGLLERGIDITPFWVQQTIVALLEIGEDIADAADASDCATLSPNHDRDTGK